MFKVLRRLFVAVLVLIGLATVAGIAWLALGGMSARPAPGRFESALAPRLRSLAIPSSARALRNPVPASPQVIAEGLEHFADHCAVCHGNDGSGDTEMGRGLYPRVPDMRKPATQNLSDGELFYIIENGMRFTGMPAWAHEGAEDNWHLVHFIRHQPRLTPAELARMKALNPKVAAEDEAPSKKPKPPAHTHTHPRK